MPELFFADRVRERSLATGTGPLSLDGALPGFASFAATVPPGATFHYAVEGSGSPPQWEAGTGSLDAQGRLVRLPHAGSASGAPVDFAAGVKTVALTVAAPWFAAAQTAPPPHRHAAAEIDGLGGAGSVTGSSATDGSAPVALRVTDLASGSWTTPAPFAALEFFSSDNSGPGAGVKASVRAAMENSTGTKIGLQFCVANAVAAAVPRLRLSAEGFLQPVDDGLTPLGQPAARWSVVHAASGAINTSDAAMKRNVEPVPDAWLEAWGEVGWSRFRFVGGRRWHVGLVAQAVHAAFARHGIDGFEIGLLCRDTVEDGERWGLRYEEWRHPEVEE